jgi:hypothetical protein
MVSGEDRYRFDPEFHALVDSLLSAIMRLQYTPSEMRDAVMVASIMYERTKITRA